MKTQPRRIDFPDSTTLGELRAFNQYLDRSGAEAVCVVTDDGTLFGLVRALTWLGGPTAEEAREQLKRQSERL